MAGAVEIFVYLGNKKRRAELEKVVEDAKFKTYKAEILNALGDKMGYNAPDIRNATEAISQYLPDLIDYSVLAYFIFRPEKISFYAYKKEIVPAGFVAQVKSKMIEFASSIKIDLSGAKIEEKIWGPENNSESDERVGSVFCIPLQSEEKIVGIMAVASNEKNIYSEKEISVLSAAAQQAAQAISKIKKIIEIENSKLNAMVESMSDGVVMTDMYYNILIANPAAKKAAGIASKKEISINDFIAGIGGKINLKDKIEESVRLGKDFLSEEISLSSGFFKVAVLPVKNNLETFGCVIIFKDITKEKEVEQIKEDFTSMIVHELRSPLDSIKKMVETMRTSDVKKNKREEVYQMIYGSSADMLELIGNLLDIAKIEAGKFAIVKQKSNIKKTIESRILFFDIAAKDAKVKLQSQFGKEIPESVDFDPHTISQVLNNLISNALKFTKENGNIFVQAMIFKKGESLQKTAQEAGVKWFVKKDILDVADSLVVAVTDSGVGIAPDQINKLFNKFVQAKTDFVKGGTGLGLAITKSIVESHGGIVGAESEVEKGSTFYFTLPI